MVLGIRLQRVRVGLRLVDEVHGIGEQRRLSGIDVRRVGRVARRGATGKVVDDLVVIDRREERRGGRRPAS